MKLLYITDNGFYEIDGKAYCDSSNYEHYKKLRRYFDNFIFFARRNNIESSYNLISSKENEVFLFEKSIKGIIKLIKKLKNVLNDVDVVICYGMNGFLAHKISMKFKKPTVIYVGGCIYDLLKENGGIIKRIIAPIFFYFWRRMIRDAKYVHYCDQFLKERYPTNGKILICSGVSIDVKEKILRKRIKSIEIGNFEKVKIGMIGFVNSKLKGIDIAIKALAFLDENIELHVVGRGNPNKLALLAKKLSVENRVFFKGTLLGGEEIFNWLDSVDIYIQPSRAEGLPRATIEAMSRGCPIISTKVGGLVSLIDSSFQVEISDYKELANKIKSLWFNKEELKKLAIQNFKNAKEYSPYILEKKYDDFYNFIIRKI